jgi:hypothetical protein
MQWYAGSPHGDGAPHPGRRRWEGHQGQEGSFPCRIFAAREPSCQIVQRAPEDARVSLERRHKNRDRTIDDIGEAGKNVKTLGNPIYNPGCLALVRQQRYVVWPDKFKLDIGTQYDGTTNPVDFLQLYVVAIQAARGDQRAMANWFPMALKDAP